MALRLNGFVVRGEIRNGNRNSVSGWLEIVPQNEEAVESRFGRPRIMLSLTGNLQGDLEGRTFRFEVREEDFQSLQPLSENGIAWDQIGAMGDSLFRMIRTPLIPIDEFIQARRRGETPLEEERPSLYLEWYSQNGRVVLELTDPTLEFAESYVHLADPTPEELPEVDIDAYPGITSITSDESGEFIEPNEMLNSDESATDDDPFSLFPADLDEQIRLSAFDEDAPDETLGDDGYVANESVVRDDDDDSDNSEFGSSQFIVPDNYPNNTRSWDEVIPGIDPKTKALYEQWDEVLHGTKDEPLTWLFEEPLSLPKPDDVRDEEHAWQVLSTLLAAMATRGVAFDMCPHFTAMQAYRLLIEELLPEASIHPNLVATGFVQHYSSYESCDECQAEFDEEYRKKYPET